MATTTLSGLTHALASNNPFRPRALSATGTGLAPDDIAADLNDAEASPRATWRRRSPSPDERSSRPVEGRPRMYDRHRSSSAPNARSPGSSSSSGTAKQFRLARKPPPPPPRPIFPVPDSDFGRATDSEPQRQPREKSYRTGSSQDLERQEKILLERAIEESKRESNRRAANRLDEDEQLRRAIEASQREAAPVRTPPNPAQETAEIERALALSTAEHEARLPRASNTPSPSKPAQSGPTNPPASTGSRSRSVSSPETLPPFPFTEQDLVRPSYPKEKSHLFPQGRPSLPPGAGTPRDEYEQEMEMLTLAIRMSEEEERLRQEREELELREVVRRVEEKENAALLASGARTSAQVSPTSRRQPPSTSPRESTSAEPNSPTASPKQSKRSPWFRPPLASKFSTASPPASPPLSPESIDRPALEATPTDSTTRSNATSYRSAAESLAPFTNLIPNPAVPNDLSTRLESQQQQRPRRRPPAPPQPTRLPPSPPETPIAPNSASFAPPIPPLPEPYTARSSRRNTFESESSGGLPLSPPSEAFRHENDGSPVEMPYLTPSAANSIRSNQRGSNDPSSAAATRLHSWSLDDRNGSNNSGGSGSAGSRSGSTGDHSRVNSTRRESLEVTGGPSGNSPHDRSETGHGEGSVGRRSFEEGDDRRGEDFDDRGSLESEVRLAIRNPDSSPAPPPVEFQHQGGFVSEPPAVDVPRDVEAGDATFLESLDGGGPVFESAYAGRSMSAIDEQTEPASSIIAEDGFSRQGSYPSTDSASLDPTIHRGETERVLEGGDRGSMGGSPGVTGGQEMRTSITYHARPIDEREWMHENALRRPSHPAPLVPPDSLTPTPPRRESPPQVNLAREPDAAHARQVTASSAVTNSSAGPRLSFPLPPFAATLAPTSASPVDSSSVSSTSALTPRLETSDDLAQAPMAIESTTGAAVTATTTVFADGTRFGHPSICAREPGHVCPHDGLDNRTDVPESIELTALVDDRRRDFGLGVHHGSISRRREETTGGKSILRDAWAVETRSFGGLLRFLMWYGDTKLVASPEDVALEPTRHCTAAASLEFRPDDEGYTVIRLVISILAPDDPDAHAHHELSVEVAATTPPAHGGSKGKGKSRSYFSEPSASTTNLATFHLPDHVHLPCRLSNLAIQLYTLRHLASIARSTLPAREGGTASYHALRQLSISLEHLAATGESRVERDASSHQARAHHRGQSGGGGGYRTDENERLLTRLRDRLRRLKRNGGNENYAPYGAPQPATLFPSTQRPNKLVKPPPMRRDTNGQSRDEQAVPGPPPPGLFTRTAQPVSRAERILSANDHDHEYEYDERRDAREVLIDSDLANPNASASGSAGGSGNHLELDNTRFSMVRRGENNGSSRDRIPEAWTTPNRRNLDVSNETSYLPVL